MKTSLDVLVVDSSRVRQQHIANGLYSDAHNVRVTGVDNFHDALGSLAIGSILGKPYDAYVVHNPFSRYKRQEPQDLSIEFAEKVFEIEGTSDKIFVADSDFSMLLDARHEGYHRLYYEGQEVQSSGVKPIDSLIPDLRRFLKIE